MSEQILSAIISAKARDTLSATLTFSNYLSPPIPIMEHSMFFIGFLIGKGEVIGSERGYQIWPPSLLALYSVSNGQFEELRALSPKDSSQEVDPPEALSHGISPPEKTSPEYLENQLKLFQSFDNLANAVLSLGIIPQEIKTKKGRHVIPMK